MKTNLLALAGVVQGVIGAFWNRLALAFAFPDSGPGSGDWEEEVIHDRRVYYVR